MGRKPENSVVEKKYDKPLTLIQVKKIVVEKITELQGVKATTLVTELPNEVIEWGSVRKNDILQVFEELVKDGEILEIEYVLPSINYRTKSFYVPKDTKITIIDVSE